MPHNASSFPAFSLFASLAIVGAITLGALSQIGSDDDKGKNNKQRQGNSSIGCLMVFHLTIAALLVFAMLLSAVK